MSLKRELLFKVFWFFVSNEMKHSHANEKAKKNKEKQGQRKRDVMMVSYVHPQNRRKNAQHKI